MFGRHCGTVATCAETKLLRIAFDTLLEMRLLHNFERQHHQMLVAAGQEPEKAKAILEKLPCTTSFWSQDKACQEK